MSDRGRVVVVTGTRAEFGLLEPIITGLRERPRLSGWTTEVVVAGTHLVEELGSTVKTVAARFPVASRVQMQPPDDTPRGMGLAVARGLEGFLEVFDVDPVDLLVVLGDRTEAFAAALAAGYLGVPLAHVHGGDRTGNAIDDFQRDAISRLATLHLAATATSASRLEALGVGGSIVLSGAPGLDAAVGAPARSRVEVADALGLPAGGWIVVLHHPLPMAAGGARGEMRAVLDAALQLAPRLGCGLVVIYPNNDAGHRAIVEEIRAMSSRPGVVTFQSLPRSDYLDLLHYARILVGNSSCGVIESASLGLPVVNVGERQRGRERNGNVVDAVASVRSIVEAASRALQDPDVQEAARSRRNVYGDGRACERIVAAIEILLTGPVVLVEETETGAPAEVRP